MGLFGKKKETTTLAPLEGDGTFKQHVVGESFYKDALAALVKGATREQMQVGRIEKLAVLMPEPANQYDPRAIAVVIDGKKVGHVPKPDLDLIHEVIDTVKGMGYTYPAVKAVLTWDASAGPKIVGVFYDLKYDRDGEPVEYPRPTDRPKGTGHPLVQGTRIALVDVDEALVAEIRESTPREPQVGHVVDVAMQLDSKGDIWAYLKGGFPLGRLDPDLAHLYKDQFRELNARNEFGTTQAQVKWDGAKSSHTVALNWANDGIL
jgi:hypothetical protein